MITHKKLRSRMHKWLRDCEPTLTELSIQDQHCPSPEIQARLDDTGVCLAWLRNIDRKLQTHEAFMGDDGKGHACVDFRPLPGLRFSEPASIISRIIAYCKRVLSFGKRV
jgi:hypothetical protein